MIQAIKTWQTIGELHRLWLHYIQFATQTAAKLLMVGICSFYSVNTINATKDKFNKIYTFRW